MKRNFSDIFEPVLDFILPALCIECGTPLPSGRKIICRDCFEALPRLPSPILDSLRQEISPVYFDDLFVLFPFVPQIQKLIHSLKYQRALSVAGYFGEALHQFLPKVRFDLITAIPLHPARQRERGYNQSAQIGGKFAELRNAPFDPFVLERIKNTRSQTRLNRAQRKENVRDAFTCAKDVAGKTVLLIDDVITTGSTLNECARVLKAHHASMVLIAAIATPVDFFQRQQERNIETLIQGIDELA